MKINIHELKMKSEVTFKGKQTIEICGVNQNRNIQMCEADVEGTATRSGNRYLVEGTVTAPVKLLCARCIEEFEYLVSAELYKAYSSDAVSDDDLDEDIIQVTESDIDLEDAITEAVYLNIPMQWIHDETCKGICKVCGQNLNKHTCECNHDEIDPRLEGLKNIFRS